MGSFSFEGATDRNPFWIASSASSEETRMEEVEPPSVEEPEEDEEVEHPSVAAPEEDEEEDIRWKCGCSTWREEEWPRKSSGGVTLEGYVETGDGGEGADGVSRTKSLTDEDLEELKGCLDLGFGFNYEEIPELCNTLPALELCYSMSQRFLDEQQQQQNRSLDRSSSGESMDLCASPTPPPVANWKISSPGDDPDEVKARLKYWAQAVACTIRLCK
ncbi:uncharacterized protein LOC122005012 [Zingiber officinale]|uniref:Uncharacterized protein n=1 Tax=Zingiber officinale TaxID=94328 RepID=A0A8J5KT75_ZINOF|nr:uncharacterized protein LOC122005012 [Zingiber officinale]KAG6488553.1 hypothetical protein ZIOFF_049799 [Zingiber officinale]